MHAEFVNDTFRGWLQPEAESPVARPLNSPDNSSEARYCLERRNTACRELARRATTVGVVVLAAIIALATWQDSASADSPPKVISAADTKAIDRLFAEYNHAGVPGAAVAVIRHGRPALIRAYGLAELDTKRPVTDRTNFRLASLTKPFTAMAVLLLVREGRLTLDTRVADIVS